MPRIVFRPISLMSDAAAEKTSLPASRYLSVPRPTSKVPLGLSPLPRMLATLPRLYTSNCCGTESRLADDEAVFFRAEAGVCAEAGVEGSGAVPDVTGLPSITRNRSEERRVGKEGRCRWAGCDARERRKQNERR